MLYQFGMLVDTRCSEVHVCVLQSVWLVFSSLFEGSFHKSLDVEEKKKVLGQRAAVWIPSKKC